MKKITKLVTSFHSTFGTPSTKYLFPSINKLFLHTLIWDPRDKMKISHMRCWVSKYYKKDEFISEGIFEK